MTSALQRIIVSPTAPDGMAVGRAAECLRRGGIAAIPTDTLYGLAADPFSPAAVQRIFTIKDRATERALPLVASSLEQVEQYLGTLPALGRRLAAHFWPGPLTLIVAAPPAIAPDAIGGGTTVGVRVPNHAVTQAVCAAFDGLLTATSANISGQPPTDDPDVVVATIGRHLDVLVDSGRTPGGPPSTIVDITQGEPRLVRAGAIAWDSVLASIRE